MRFVCESAKYFNHLLKKGEKLESLNERTALNYLISINNDILNNQFKGEANELFLAKFANELIDYIEFNLRIKCHSSEIIDALTQHLKATWWGYFYNIHNLNAFQLPHFDRHESELEVLYLLQKIFFESHHLFLTKMESIYISMHLLSHQTSENMKVLVACKKGKGSQLFLKKQLSEWFTQFEFVEDQADLIISDCILSDKNPKDYLLVNTVLSKEDISKINQFLRLKQGNSYEEIEIFHSLKGLLKDDVKYIDVKKQLLISKNKKKDGYKPMLEDLITTKTIKLLDHVATWQDAIIECGSILEKQKKITANYIKCMIESVNQFGSYIVLIPKLAVPHSRPEDGVIETSMSLMTLQTPVLFPDNKPVNVVICVASVDNEQHLVALSELMSLLENEECVDDLIALNNAQDIVDYIKNNL